MKSLLFALVAIMAFSVVASSESGCTNNVRTIRLAQRLLDRRTNNVQSISAEQQLWRTNSTQCRLSETEEEKRERIRLEKQVASQIREIKGLESPIVSAELLMVSLLKSKYKVEPYTNSRRAMLGGSHSRIDDYRKLAKLCLEVAEAEEKKIKHQDRSKENAK